MNLSSRHFAGSKTEYGRCLAYAFVQLCSRDVRARAEPLWELLLGVSPLSLGLGMALQGGTFLSVAIMLQRAVVGGGKPRTVRKLFPLALAKQFVSQAVPSIGLTGNLMLTRGLQNLGVPRALVLQAVFGSLLSYYLALALILMATIVIFWLLRDLTRIILTALSASPPPGTSTCWLKSPS